MKSKNAWISIGNKDPYYGVLTSEKFRGAKLSDVLHQEFYDTGVKHISMLSEQFVELNDTSLRVLDFGCGVGRILHGFASKGFANLVGVDISPAMLDLTHKNLSKLDIKLDLADDLEHVEGRVDLFHSVICLQHIEPAIGYAILRKGMQLISDKGIFLVQMPIKINRSILRTIIYRLQIRSKYITGCVNLLKGKKFHEPMMQMNSYDLSVVLADLKNYHFENFKIFVFPEENVFSIYVYAEKCPSLEK